MNAGGLKARFLSHVPPPRAEACLANVLRAVARPRLLGRIVQPCRRRLGAAGPRCADGARNRPSQRRPLQEWLLRVVVERRELLWYPGQRPTMHTSDRSARTPHRPMVHGPWEILGRWTGLPQCVSLSKYSTELSGVSRMWRNAASNDLADLAKACHMVAGLSRVR